MVVLEGSLDGWVVGVVLLGGCVVRVVLLLGAPGGLWGGWALGVALWVCGLGGFAFGGVWWFWGGCALALCGRCLVGGRSWVVLVGLNVLKKQRQFLQGPEQKVNQAIRRDSAAALLRVPTARFPLWGCSASQGCTPSGGGKLNKRRTGFPGD